MEYTFYFESNFRTWRNANYLKFQMPDNTEFILSEEWVISTQRRKRTPMQRLIFLKRNNYGNIYRVTVEVSSTSNKATGKIVVLRKTKTLRTSILILLADFQQLRYPIRDKVHLENVQICERVIYDTFKYKVTVIRLDEGQSQTEIIPKRDAILTMCDQFQSLLETGYFSDIIMTFRESNYEIEVHRNILAARSVFFACMFEHNWIENQESRIVIAKTDVTVFKEILRYIYSGVIRTMKFSLVVDLYMAADKFLLDDLKGLISEELRKSLNAENAVFIYMLGHYHLDRNLKDSCLVIIRNNFGKVQNTGMWKYLTTSREPLGLLDYSEIMETILQNVN